MSGAGALRLAVVAEGQEGMTWDVWRRLAEQVQRVGFEALLCTDHYLPCRPGANGDGLDAWATVAALAPLFPGLGLGTLVSPVGFRHPAVLARTAATAQVVSGGRIDIGLGAGWNEQEHREFGFAFGTMPERLDTLESTLRTLRRLLAPRSAADDAPALLVGADRGTRALRLAARWADEFNTRTASPARCRELRAALDQACVAAGRPPGAVALSVLVNYLVGEDDDELDVRAQRLMALRGEAAASPREWREQRRGRWLIGTPAAVAEHLHQLHAAGASRVVLMQADPEDVASLGAFGELAALQPG
jgi:alkanesulfonate monooxygenase SsuD/methylene tetrahydromethanopterin reductase-like flavin-dependent oxidoreductase (luciferase family)